jgi:RNA polymerase sigma-70 factor (ECF subfamily)
MVFRRCLFILKNEDEAQDGVQEIFTKLAAGLDITRVASPTAYLWRMATNYSLNRLKRERRSVTLPPDPVDPSSDMERDVVRKILVETLFSRVSPRTRELAWYRWVDGLTWEETALASGLSVSGVRKHLAQFLTKAREKEHP